MLPARYVLGFYLSLDRYHLISLTSAVSMPQAPVTSTITTVLTALTSFGLCAVSAWFATERWIFMRYRGRKWLDDVLMEITDTMLQNRVIDLSRHGLEKVGSGLVVANSVAARMLVAFQTRFNRLFGSRGSRHSNKPDDNESVLPVSSDCTSNHKANPNNPNSNNNSKESGTNVMSIMSTYGRKSSETVLALQTNVGPSTGPRSPSIISQEKSPIPESPNLSGTPFPTSNVSAGKQRWRDAIRAVRIRAAIATDQDPASPMVVGTPREPARRRTTSSNLTDKKRPHSQTRGTVAKSRLADLVPKLKVLDATQDLAAHTALVKHIQFSPDGKYLATSRYVCLII